LLGAVASVAMAGSASAGGWYVAGEAGLNGFGDADVTGTFLGAPTSGEVSSDLGWAIMATVGNAFSPGWRLEGELGFRNNDTTSDLARVEHWSLMLNVLYDFKLSTDFDLSLGGGLGVDHSKFNISGVTSDTDINAALQAILGLSYAIGPDTDLTLTYRYMAVIDPSFQFGDAATLNFDSIDNRTLTIGLRWHLGGDSRSAGN
jgi:OmpA-OmpF porin, OOP family